MLVKIKITLLLLTFSLNAHSLEYNMSDYYYGFSRGYHLDKSNLNNDHPFIGYEKNNIGGIAFLNSFNKVSLGIYKSLPKQLSEYFYFVTKIGLTTGYKKKDTYKGEEYNLTAMPFISNNIVVIVIPSIEYKFDSKHTIDLSLLGNSVNLGFSIKFY
jgi:hypothetical protein